MIVPNVVPRPPALRAVLFARYHGGGTNSSESDVQASGALYLLAGYNEGSCATYSIVD